eukprot:TRINITY_DN7688_c1_g1_i1.p1 TRINITY_DN7688_c1_g1~~TRINITY_DN7688_c1_g1_i1.p1  ORF type:complete len:742 (+),score=146.61 TRINITY_DN7688_c1_g1_i1:98-2323(+)
MPSKKPVYATHDEVVDLEKDIAIKLDELKAELTANLQEKEKLLKGTIEATRDTVTANSTRAEQETSRVARDAKEYTEQSGQNLDKRLSSLIAATKVQVEQAEATLQDKLQQLEDTMNQKLRQTVTVLSEAFQEELNVLETKVTENITSAANTAAQELADEQKQRSNAISETRAYAEYQGQLAHEAAKTDLRHHQEVQAKSDTDRDDHNKQIHDEVFDDLARLDVCVRDNHDLAQSNLHQTESLLQSALAKLKTDAGNRLDSHTRHMEKLKNAVEEVENLSTKRVDWVVNNMASRLRPNSATSSSRYMSWFSPRFNIGGCHGLQLELQYYKPSNPPIPGEEYGDAAVLLWACKGVNLVYRLYIGGKYQTVEKMFNGRMPCGTRRLCFLRDQIDQDSGSLRVSVEILECHRQIEHPIRAQKLGGDEAEEEEEDAEEEELDGMIYFHRHINNRLFEQVKQKVDVMSSRMVKKVEWRVEQASKLRSCFPQGEPICSAQFNAAGLENLQLLFYPSGYNGAADGTASLFVYGPAGAAISCTLFLGQQKREASNNFATAGAFGCTNFCRFETIVDKSDDTVTVGIEIKEAQANMIADMAHPAVLNQESGGVRSVVKLQANPGRQSHGGLEDKRVLPSIWTSHFEKSIAQAPDGMHTFDELALKTRGKGRTGAFAVAVSPTGQSTLGASRSHPALPAGSAAAEDCLPRLGASPSPSSTAYEGFGNSTMRPRRQRRNLSATAGSLVRSSA